MKRSQTIRARSRLLEVDTAGPRWNKLANEMGAVSAKSVERQLADFPSEGASLRAKARLAGLFYLGTIAAGAVSLAIQEK